jgi:hypothetical protein
MNPMKLIDDADMFVAVAVAVAVDVADFMLSLKYISIFRSILHRVSILVIIKVFEYCNDVIT